LKPRAALRAGAGHAVRLVASAPDLPAAGSCGQRPRHAHGCL